MNALLSVSDKTGIVELAQALHAQGVALLSTGGTAKLLSDAGLPVTEVAEMTGFPEMLDGRVKTLHPRVHGGLLARRDLPAHMAVLAAHQIDTIDFLVVNLYPFDRPWPSQVAPWMTRLRTLTSAARPWCAAPRKLAACGGAKRRVAVRHGACRVAGARCGKRNHQVLAVRGGIQPDQPVRRSDQRLPQRSSGACGCCLRVTSAPALALFPGQSNGTLHQGARPSIRGKTLTSRQRSTAMCSPRRVPWSPPASCRARS